MAIEVFELANSRGGTTDADPQRDRYVQRWCCVGTDDDVLAQVKIEEAAPTEYLGLPKATLVLSPLNPPDTYFATITYSASPGPSRNLGSSQFEFEISLSTITATQSLGTQGYAEGGGAAPDEQGTIGVDENGRVNGAQIGVPSFAWSETFYWLPDEVTQAYRLLVRSLVGTKNATPFRQLPAGSVLFAGTRGRQDNQVSFPITYRFEYNANRSNYYVGSILVPFKAGWDFEDIRYEEFDDTLAERLIKRPKFVYIHKVYEDQDFSQLGIGT